MSFEKLLQIGKTGESLISTFFKKKGYSILPVYELINQEFKGPQVFSNSGNFIAPDMIIFKKKKSIWIECKYKTAFSWYRKKQIWTTGIDKKCFLDYCKIAELSPFPVWIFFLQMGGTAKDSPKSDSGLFAQKTDILKDNIDHESNNWAKGMIYWNKDLLIKIASIDMLKDK